MRLLLLALLLTGCAPRPLALVLSIDPLPMAATLESRGWEVRTLPMPCDGDLQCWAAHPERIAPWLAETRASLKGQNVTVIGVSRGGYLALRMAGWPEVSQVVALSPVTDLSRLAEFQGRKFGPLDPGALQRVRTYIEIGSSDERVGTDAALAYANAAMNPGLTLVVTDIPGHSLAPPDAALAWLESGDDLSVLQRGAEKHDPR